MASLLSSLGLRKSAAASAPPPSGNIPPKFIDVNGVKKLNPAWKDYMAKQKQPVQQTAPNPEQALLVITNKGEYDELCSVWRGAGKEPPQLAETVTSTEEIVREDADISRKVGLAPDAVLPDLEKVFARYEIPIGMMNKLMGLSEYDGMEFIVDDSGSMGSWTDALNSRGQRQTRWEEAREGLETMLEILAHVPIAPITIRFLNRKDKIMLDRKGETPERFLEGAKREIARVFAKGPEGNTPILRCLSQCLDDGRREEGEGVKKVIRYLFCDGVPNGGQAEVEAVKKLLCGRPDPQGNPFTLLSCSDQDHEVEWMKDVEEVAPFCAELDDFEDEAREVVKDQGEVFPYTKGFYLVCKIVAAMNPDDLDALDESAPMTKMTLDNLLGVVSSEQEYRRYFDGFKEAQRKRPIESRADQAKKNHNWEPQYRDFLNCPIASKIPAVKQFKEQLDKLIMS